MKLKRKVRMSLIYPEKNLIVIGVNFYKAARLEPPPPLFRLQGFQAFEPPTFSSCMIRGVAHLF